MTTDNTNNSDAVPDEEVETFTCEWCDTETPQDEMANESPDLCSDCNSNAVDCDDCGVRVHYDEYTYVEQTDTRVCERCSQDYSYCYRHDNRYPDGDGCYSCQDEGDSDDYNYGGRVQGYSYKPAPVFRDFINGSAIKFTTDRGVTPLTGFELEMEYCDGDPDSIVDKLDDIFGDFVYFKTDGSLNHGVEMVSHPASLSFLRSLEWNRMGEVTKLGARSANSPGKTCGLHVHISKKYFEGRETTFYRFLNMYYSFAEQWKVIGGRDSHYGQFVPLDEVNMLGNVRYMASHGVGQSLGGNRYVAVNLQNRHTAELRFFQGTLNPVTLLARIESVHAVAQFARASQFKVNPKALTWDMFRQFTKDEGYEAFDLLATKKGV